MASAPPTSSVVTPKDTNLFTSSTQQQSDSSPRATTAKRTPSVGTTGHGSSNASVTTTATTTTTAAIAPSSTTIEPNSTLELLDLRECQHLLNNKKESHPRLKFTEGVKLGVAPIFSTSSSPGTTPTGTAINDSVNLASSTNNNRAKVLSSKQLNMNLISGGSGVPGPPTPHPVSITLPLIASATFKNSNLHRNHAPVGSNNGSSGNNTNHLNNLNNNNNNHLHNNNNNVSSLNNNNNNNNDNDNMHELKPSTKLCSPPPLDERDVEQQIHRFELEI
uniref:Uncharacterized protein n=1 Tax=Anopheles culicifacies TaxID=139723 RepID=A0A182MI66_9DIPT